MKKKGIVLAMVVIVLAAIVAGAVVLRSKPLVPADKEYLLHIEKKYLRDIVIHDKESTIGKPAVTLWPQGPDDSYETRKKVVITEEQEQAVLDILSRYSKRLSLKSVRPEMPEWLEAQVVLYHATENGEDLDIFNIVLGDGHAQQREDYTFYPPCYTIENEEQLYKELSEALNLPELMENARNTAK